MTAPELTPLIEATLLLHDALCSLEPEAEWEWPEVEAAIKTLSSFGREHDAGVVEQALHDNLSREDHAAYIAMTDEVQAALGELLNPQETVQ